MFEKLTDKHTDKVDVTMAADCLAAAIHGDGRYDLPPESFSGFLLIATALRFFFRINMAS